MDKKAPINVRGGTRSSALAVPPVVAAGQRRKVYSRLPIARTNATVKDEGRIKQRVT